MKLVTVEPTKTYIVGDLSTIELSLLKRELTYTNKAVQFEVKRLEKQVLRFSGARQAILQEEINELRSKVKVCLLKEDCSGFWFYSGLTPRVQKLLRCEIENQVVYPEGRSLPWAVPPEFKMYPYQETSVNELLKAKHAGVELCTGAGKSLALLNLIRELGLKTLIVTPSSSISEQLYKSFVKHLGKKYVGAFWGGKKESKKLIVIGNGQSVTRLEPGDKEYKDLAESQVVAFDESHTCPATTFEKVCHGIVSKAPYRFFFSATQLRNDGQDLLLEGITGPMVHHLTANDAMNRGYLAKTWFKMVHVNSNLNFESSDVNEMTRKHLYYNPEVIEFAAKVANLAVATQGHQVLILIDEIDQFNKIFPLLKFECRFAHGGTGGDKLPEQFKKSDPNQLVKEFNERKYPILIGTSCISTGTDIKSVKTMIYIKGGKSKTEFFQGVGRCTRLMSEIGKTECNVFDFLVANVPVLEKHARIREKYANEINGPVKHLKAA